MAVQFCTDCGDLLPHSPRREVACECCGAMNTNQLRSYVSVSSTDKFPSELRDRRGPVQTPNTMSPADTWSKVDVTCPKCRGDDVRYATVQLRSADEGSTVFYFCSKCSNRWNEDN